MNAILNKYSNIVYKTFKSFFHEYLNEYSNNQSDIRLTTTIENDKFATW